MRPVRKPRQPGPRPQRHTRLYAAAPSSPYCIMDLADGRGVVCYFVLPLSADFGQCFRLEKFTCHGGQVYHVNLRDSHRDRHCDCPGHCYTGCGQHVLGLLALRAAGKLLPPVDLEEPCGRAFPDDVPDLHEGASYKPGHSSALPF